jgi:hypothetical protein
MSYTNAFARIPFQHWGVLGDCSKPSVPGMLGCSVEVTFWGSAVSENPSKAYVRSQGDEVPKQHVSGFMYGFSRGDGHADRVCGLEQIERQERATYSFLCNQYLHFGGNLWRVGKIPRQIAPGMTT